MGLGCGAITEGSMAYVLLPPALSPPKLASPGGQETSFSAQFLPCTYVTRSGDQPGLQQSQWLTVSAAQVRKTVKVQFIVVVPFSKAVSLESLL